MNRSRSRVSSVTTPARSALWMYCRVFFFIAPRSSSSPFDRSMSSVRRGCTNTGEACTPTRARPARTAASSGTSGSHRRLAQRSCRRASRRAAIASARRSGATSGPRGAYATEMPSGSDLSNTCATPPSSTKRRTRQPVAARSSPQAADCRTCGSPLATTSSSQRWRSPGVASVALRRRGSRPVLARRFFAGQLARREGALGIALAAVEERAPATAALDQLALAAQRAGHAGPHLRLLDVFAVRITGAADERTVAAAPTRERLSAVRAHLAFDDLELRLCLAFERLRVIAGAGRLRLALLRPLESGARVEAPEPTELDDDRPSALGADAIGLLLGDVGLLDRLRLLLDELDEGREEIAHHRDPLGLAPGDAVEIELHARGESVVDDVREVLLQEVGDDEAGVFRHERAALLADVLAAGEGRDRRRVRRGAVDAVLLERLHQRGLGVAGRRLREVLRRVETEELQILARCDLGQRSDLLLGLIGALGVHADESVEGHAPSVRAQHVWSGVDVEPRVLEPRRRHLRRERALPDERVQLELVRLQELLHVGRRAREVRGTDRLVRLLGALRARLVMTRLLERVLGAELLGDDVLGLMQSALGHVQGVGPHIGDESDRHLAERDALVELLREDHRALHREAELARRVLLKRRRGERRRGVPRALVLLEALDDVLRVRERRPMLVGRLAGVDVELVALVLDHLGGERLTGVVRQERVDAPVLLGLERLDLALAVDDEPQRDRLDAAGGQPVADLLPEERRHRVAHETVDDAARLLSVHQILVDVTGMLGRVGDRRGGDLVESDAPQLALRPADHIRQMPGDRLALAVEVGREPDVRRGLRLFAQQPGVFLGVVGDDVLGCERHKVDPELRLRQVADMAVGGLDLESGTEHPFEGPGLGRRFHDHQVLFCRVSHSDRLSHNENRPHGRPTAPTTL